MITNISLFRLQIAFVIVHGFDPSKNSFKQRVYGECKNGGCRLALISGTHQKLRGIFYVLIFISTPRRKI